MIQIPDGAQQRDRPPAGGDGVLFEFISAMIGSDINHEGYLVIKRINILKGHKIDSTRAITAKKRRRSLRTRLMILAIMAKSGIPIVNAITNSAYR